jgi:hypothetical protein
MMTKPRTSSAGTPEIAQDSGGDSISVNDASALQEILARIRQRYALFFNLPDGVQPGQERNIELALTPAALARYPGAQVHYRRVYMTPESGVPSPTWILRQLRQPPRMNYSVAVGLFH